MNEDEPMVEYEVTYTQTYTFTMEAPADIAREDLWELAEAEYADVTGATLEDHTIEDVTKR